jgi:hypothetical protein
MKTPTKYILAMVLALIGLATASPAQTNSETRTVLGLATNGPAIVELTRITRITTVTNRFPPHLATNPAVLRVFPREVTYTNAEFKEFLPTSLNHAIWTNFLARTNGRNLRIWQERKHPATWPTNPPVAVWNTNSILWGMKGMTALSPCWQGEGSPGQVALTALTRRHAYTRGHGMGEDGFNTKVAGRKAWFLTRNNQLTEMKVSRCVVRCSAGPNGVHRDYTLVLFDRDLPESIETIAVARMADILVKRPGPTRAYWPQPVFETEQGGNVSAGVPPFTVNTWKPGDSGLPNLLPLPGELVFFGGRSTSGPSPEMQADMDELCRQEGLSPQKYQLRWADLSKYPSY